MGLPLSFEMCAVGIGILIGSFWSQKSGWRPLLLWGALLVALGNVASGLVSDSLAYILSRGGAGFGYGLINLAGQVFVVSHSSPEHRAGNLSALVAGLYAGFLRGSAFGGLIADNLGYASAFLVSAGLMALIGIFLHFALPREAWTPEPSASGRISLRGLQRLFLGHQDGGPAPGQYLPLRLCDRVPVPILRPCRSARPGSARQASGGCSCCSAFVIISLGPFFGKAVERVAQQARLARGRRVPVHRRHHCPAPSRRARGGFRLRGAARPVQCHRRQRAGNLLRFEIPVSRAGRIRQDGGDLQYHRTARPNARPGRARAGDRPVGREFGADRDGGVSSPFWNILFALTGRLAKAGA